MESEELKKLALIGLTGGLLITSASLSGEKPTTSPDVEARDPSEGNLGYKLMTEEDLILELNPQGYAVYQSLDDEGKELARYVASQRCNGTNACKGLNACSTDEHTCAGLGSCKGQGKCAFSDKNLAVKLVAKKMAEKRAKATEK